MSWAYRRKHVIYSDTGQIEKNYTIKLIIGRSSSPSEPTSGSNTLYIDSTKLRSTYSDLRFVVNNQAVPHWDKTGSGDLREIYVKIPRLLPDIGTDLYILYGNSSAITSTSSSKETVTYFNNFTQGDLKGINITGNVTWTNLGRPDICPTLKYGVGSTYGKLESSGAFNTYMSGYMIEVPAAFGTGINSYLMMYTLSGGHAASFRRGSSTSTIIAEYDMDTINTISGVSTTFNTYSLHFYNGYVYYVYNGTTIGSHAFSNTPFYLHMNGNSSSSTSEVAADYMLVRKTVWNGSGEMIHQGEWSTEESGGYFCLPYDTTFDNLQLYIDGRSNIFDRSYPPHELSYTNSEAGISVTDNRFGLPMDSLYFYGTTLEVGDVSSYTFLHNTTAESTIMMWIRMRSGTIGSQTLLDTGYYTITIDESMIPTLTITNGSSNIVQTTFTSQLTIGDWIFVAFTYNQRASSNQANMYIGYDISSDVMSGGTGTKTSNTPTANNQPAVLTVGNNISSTSQLNADISELMIFDRCFTSAETNAIYKRTKRGFIYPVMDTKRGIT